MEQRGLCGTVLSTCRAPAVQVDSRVKPENDINFKAQSPSQTPPEQRGLLSTVHPTDRSGRCLWIAGSSPAMTVSCSIPHPARLGALSK